MDVNRLRTGEKIAGIAGIALIIIMFLSWWGAPGEIDELAESLGVAADETTANAWQLASFMDIIWFLTGAVAVALAAAAVMARNVALPVAASAITAALGILSTLLILYRLIDPPYDAGREYGVFLGLIAAAAIAYGGWRSMQEEGTTFSGEADRLGDRHGGPGTGPGATTPGAGPTTGTGTTGTTTPPGSQSPPPPPPPTGPAA